MMQVWFPLKFRISWIFATKSISSLEASIKYGNTEILIILKYWHYQYTEISKILKYKKYWNTEKNKYHWMILYVAVFNIFLKTFWDCRSMRTSLLCIVGELAEGGSVDVAVVVDRWQVTSDRWHTTGDRWPFWFRFLLPFCCISATNGTHREI